MSEVFEYDIILRPFDIQPVAESGELHDRIKEKLDQKAKPIGSLGRLETLAHQIAMILGTDSPTLQNASVLIFAGDHGATAQHGISAYSREATAGMVRNFLEGGAAVNVLARQHQLELFVVDAGVDADFEDEEILVDTKIRRGTRNYFEGPAMTADECRTAIDEGSNLVHQLGIERTNCILPGDMGIGNTASAAIIMHLITGIPLNECVGPGSGLDPEGVKNKSDLLQQAVNQAPKLDKPLEILAYFGGYEIAMLAGVYLQAAKENMVILVDGFITSTALLVAQKIHPEVLDYCIFSHLSDETGHKKLLNYLDADPLLNLNMRLGEASGALVAYPLLISALDCLKEMSPLSGAGLEHP